MLSVLALLASGAFLYWFARIAVVGAAYKSKVLASALFVSGRELDSETAPEISADDYGLMRLFFARVDRARGEVSASFFGLGRRRAVYRPGLGATLAIGPLVDVKIPSPAPREEAWEKPETAPNLRTAVDEAFDEPGPRARRTRAVLVYKDGRLLAERYASGIHASTPLPGWSMSKSFTAALVGVAIKEGKLALDEKNLFSEWKDDPRREITLEHLLRMNSGLRFAEVYANPLSDVVQMLYARGDVAAYALAGRAEAAPGTIWKYSSGTSNLVSLLLRRRLGDAAYWAFPRKALLDPLGMPRAIFEPDASGTFVASSYLFATAREWLRLGALFAHDGVWEGRRLLPEGWTAFSSSVTPNSDGRYAAHWWKRLHGGLGGNTPAAALLPDDAFHALGHEGQCLTVIPSEKLVVLRLGLSIKLDGWNHAEFMKRVREAL